MCITALPLSILLFVQAKTLQTYKTECSYIEAAIKLDSDVSIGEDTDSTLNFPCTLIIPPTASGDISQLLSFGKDELTVYIPHN